MVGCWLHLMGIWEYSPVPDALECGHGAWSRPRTSHTGAVTSHITGEWAVGSQVKMDLWLFASFLLTCFHLVLQIDIDQVAKFKLCYWTSTTQSSAPAYCSLKINQKLSRRSLTFRKAREQAVNVWQLPKSFELCTFHWLILTLVFIACCDNSHKSTFLVYIESSIKSGHQGSLDSKWIYN